MFLRRNVGEGVDLVNYTWVDAYLKGRKYQEKIKALRDEIEGVRKSPRAKSEILAELKQVGDRVKALRVTQVRAVLSSWQEGKILSLTPEAFAHVVILPGAASLSPSHIAAHDFNSLLTAEVIQEAIEDLPGGLTVAEKEAKIAGLDTKIKDLEKRIADECWPDSRKVFDDTGRPDMAKDRWQEVVDHWRKVAAPYNKPVDFYGRAIKQGDPAWEVFSKLKFRLLGATTPR
jgi:hypothetical protein